MASSELDLGYEVAEPFRFNFEIAWEVANKGQIGTCKCPGISVLYTTILSGGSYVAVCLLQFMTV